MFIFDFKTVKNIYPHAFPWALFKNRVNLPRFSVGNDTLYTNRDTYTNRDNIATQPSFLLLG